MSAQGKDKVKVVMLGMYSAGKTCLVDRLVHDRFHGDTSATVGAAYNAFDATVDARSGKRLTLGIWDTAGSDRFESLTRMYTKDALAAVICYDITSAASFTKAKDWVTRVSEAEPQCLIVLVGTKADRVAHGEARGVSAATVASYAASVHAASFECSAVSDDGPNKVAEPFELIAREIAKRRAAAAATAGAQGAQGGAQRVNLKTGAGRSNRNSGCCS